MEISSVTVVLDPIAKTNTFSPATVCRKIFRKTFNRAREGKRHARLDFCLCQQPLEAEWMNYEIILVEMSSVELQKLLLMMRKQAKMDEKAPVEVPIIISSWMSSFALEVKMEIG